MNFFKNISVIAMLFFTGCVLPKATASRGTKAAPAQQRAAAPKAGAAARKTGRQPAGKQVPAVRPKSYEQILDFIETVKPTVQDYDLLWDIKTEIDRQMTLVRPKIRQPEPVIKPVLPPRIIEQPKPQPIVPVQPSVNPYIEQTKPKIVPVQPNVRPYFEQPKPQIIPVQPTAQKIVQEPAFIKPVIQPIVQPTIQPTTQPTIQPPVPPRITEQLRPQIIPVQPFAQKVGQTYLVPTNENELKRLDLCPLFGKKIAAFSVDEKKLAEDLRRQGYNEEDIVEFISPGAAPHYSVFREKRGELGSSFGAVNVATNVPCTVPLGKYGNWNRTLMQLKTLDQFELAKKTGLSAAMCGGLSLNNGRLIRAYGLTGDVGRLSKLHDIQDAAAFLRKIALNDWINVEIARDAIAKHRDELGIDGIDMSAVSTVALFDSSLVERPQELSLFDQAEFAYVQDVKEKIQAGLKRDNYVHAIVVGNIEAVQQHGHYFCFAIIKKGNEIQYIVLDTVPSAYHLQEGSHERNRLMFVIENIERGSSLIKVPNLYASPEFMGAAKLSKENMLEKALADERMQEVVGSAFEVQVKQLNAFSKRLVNAPSINEGLSREPKKNLTDYLTAIDAIKEIYGEDVAYPELRKLIVRQLDKLK